MMILMIAWLLITFVFTKLYFGENPSDHDRKNFWIVYTMMLLWWPVQMLMGLIVAFYMGYEKLHGVISEIISGFRDGLKRR